MTGGQRRDRPPPAHCSHVWPWTRPIAQRLIMPDWTAITIGRHVISWRPLDAAELAHELTHVAQWKRHGVLFIPRYLIASQRAAAAGKDRYRDNEFEAEAYAVEARVRAGRGSAASRDDDG